MLEASGIENMSREEIRVMADKICQGEYAAMQNIIQEYEIDGAIRALKSEVIQYYQYVCFDVHTACPECAALDGEIFKVSEAKAGINLAAAASKLQMHNRLLFGRCRGK